jgi:hypothetical membrane protein
MAEIGQKMECYFVMYGAIFVIIIVSLAALISPGYSPLIHTISELGYFPGKTLFSIGFVAAGCLCIPFFIRLERELVNIKENVRRAATAVSIFSSICISFVGVVPDLTSHALFLTFHYAAAITAFAGSTAYILLYSYLMYKGPKMTTYKGPVFRKYLPYYGFIIFILLLLLFITRRSPFEWILFVNILSWNGITGYFLSKYTFSGMEGMYYKKTEYAETLKKFEESLKIMKTLNLEDDPVAKTLMFNIEHIKKEMEKNK